MTDLSSDYLLEVYRTNVSIFFSLASEAFDAARKLADLNLQVGRIMLAESVVYLREMKLDAAASETAAVAAKSAFSTASETAETVRKSVRSVLEAAQANVSMATAGARQDVASQSGERA